jgi:YD repeat-containing protein
MATLLGSSLLLASVAVASETTTYTYDALGRLVLSANSGGPRNGQSSGTRYDPVGNRGASSIAQALPAPPIDNSVFSISGPAPLNEGGVAVFTVTRTGTALNSLSVNYATVDGTAVAPGDYVVTSGTLTVPYWATTATISVQTLDDLANEGAEQFTVLLSSPSPGATIGTASASATINASDTNLPPVTTADSASVHVCDTVSVNVVANDSDPEGNLPLSLVSVGTSPLGTASVETTTNVQFLAFGTTGNTSVSYTVQDSLGATATGTLFVTVLSGTGCN